MEEKYSPLKFSVLLCFMFTAIFGFSQKTQNQTHYVIEFKDKGTLPIVSPLEILSDRALQRRQKFSIVIDSSDYPVSKDYINQIVQKVPVKVILQSKWKNLIVVESSKFISISDFDSFSFVKSVKTIGTTPFVIKETTISNASSISYNSALEKVFDEYKKNSGNQLDLSQFSLEQKYAASLPQIQMLGGLPLHSKGYTGEGILVAVLDAGFKNVNKLAVFDSLRKNDKIHSVVDFFDQDGSVWEDDDHGTNVLSCMAANIPGKFIGTAPGAQYALLRTENAPYESLLEMYTWLAAAEYADSIGADLINSSLGYTKFDQAAFSLTHAMLDGKSTVITQAAELAYSKGILVMNSAGNDGSQSWKYIGAPADGINVVAVGGVNYEFEKSGFSSFGPTADGRIKPTISALATSSIVADAMGNISTSDGTSFSNPIFSGMMASLMQACNGVGLQEMVNAVCMSGSHASKPNVRLGHGVPHFEMALTILGKNSDFDRSKDYFWDMDYKRGFSGLCLRFYSAHNQQINVDLKFSPVGKKSKLVQEFDYKLESGSFLSTSDLLEYVEQNAKKLTKGKYTVEVKSKDLNYTFTFNVN
jgi:serine protease AprX